MTSACDPSALLGNQRAGPLFSQILEVAPKTLLIEG